MNDLQNVPAHLMEQTIGQAQRDGYFSGALGYPMQFRQSPTMFGTYWRIGYREGVAARRSELIRQYQKRISEISYRTFVLSFVKNLLS